MSSVTRPAASVSMWPTNFARLPSTTKVSLPPLAEQCSAEGVYFPIALTKTVIAGSVPTPSTGLDALCSAGQTCATQNQFCSPKSLRCPTSLPNQSPVNILARATPGSSARIKVSPIRKVCTPRPRISETCAAELNPLSVTTCTPAGMRSNNP